MAKKPVAASAEGSVEVRVLVAGHGHAVNDVVKMSADDAAAAVAGDWADDHPDAVAYARSLATEADAE